jgi:hypothetical protein
MIGGTSLGRVAGSSAMAKALEQKQIAAAKTTRFMD